MLVHVDRTTSANGHHTITRGVATRVAVLVGMAIGSATICTGPPPPIPPRFPGVPVMRSVASSPRRLGWFADRPVGVKIGAVLALLAVVVLGTNALAVTRIEDMRAGQETIYTESLKPLNALSAVQRATAAHRARVLEYAVSDPARRQELLGEMDEKQADVDAALADYQPYVVRQAAMDKYQGPREQFLATNAGQLFPAADAGDLATYAQIYR